MPGFAPLAQETNHGGSADHRAPTKGASGVVSCSLASLARGSSQPLQIVVTVIAKKTSITNTVTVSSVTSDPNLANNSASVTTRVK